MQSRHIEIQIKEKRRGKTEPYRNGWLIKSLYRLSEEKLIWWWVGSWPFLLLKEFSKSFSVLVSCILFLSPPLVFFTLSEIFFFLSVWWKIEIELDNAEPHYWNEVWAKMSREKGEGRKKSKSLSKGEDLKQGEMWVSAYIWMYEYSGWWGKGWNNKKERKCAVKEAVSGQSHGRRTHQDFTFVSVPTR